MLMRLQLVNYTLKHRKAFREVEKELFGNVTFRGCVHDLDKVFLYPILGKKLTTKIHRKFARHHVNSAHTQKDFKQMVVDWECARFTKVDKPLNAYDTLYKFYPEWEDRILPILQELGLDHKTEVN